MSVPAYPAYKDSGVEWLGEVPAHWGVDRLLDVASYNDEVLADGTPADFEIDYVEISGVSAGSRDLSSTAVAFGDAPSRARRVVRDGDILISTVRTYLRAIATVRGAPSNLIASTGFAVVRPRSAHPGFVGFAVQAEAFIAEVISKSVGVSYPAINASDLVRIRIPVPPPTEQAAIAAFLDRETGKIDALVEEQRRLIALLKEKRQAVISHAVTKGLNPQAPLKPSGIEWLGDIPAHWESVPLGALCSKIGSGKTPRGGAEAYVSEGVLLLRSQNVYDEGLWLDEQVFIDAETDEEMSNSRVEVGDILLNITGASLGRTCIVPPGLQRANVNQHVCIIRTRVPDLRSYVSAFLKSSPAKAQIDAFQNGAAREGLNFQQIARVALPLPPEEEGGQIAAFLAEQAERVDALIAEVELGISLLQERRAALISAAVTGKIDVRGLVATSGALEAA